MNGCSGCKACLEEKVKLQLQLDHLQFLLTHEQNVRKGLEGRLLKIHEEYAQIIREIREGKL